MKKPNQPKPGLRRLLVSRFAAGRLWRGKLIAGTLVLPCALGRAGLTRHKREGDGATPSGRRRLLFFLFRRERARLAGLRAPVRFVRKDDIWCDDPTSFSYNRLLRGPSRRGHEDLWRADRLYDVVGVLDYNIRPRVLGRGSAIFFHIATDDLPPTAGCVALRARDMARLLPRLARRATLVIG
ncbi:MAG: L,D-transpeptidase family protein [Methylocystis sp.]|nr:L,D-transpeptidase family protein [Methylocystis sp.]MBI3274465.1 L,D-transpeptidase family protein [Methylocystis sp.]